jgi:hypothetical protein
MMQKKYNWGFKKYIKNLLCRSPLPLIELFSSAVNRVIEYKLKSSRSALPSINRVIGKLKCSK